MKLIAVVALVLGLLVVPALAEARIGPVHVDLLVYYGCERDSEVYVTDSSGDIRFDREETLQAIQLGQGWYAHIVVETYFDSDPEPDYTVQNQQRNTNCD